MSSQISKETTESSFPARTRQASGFINDVHTEMISVTFSDKILFTISQDGRLAHWVHVPLSGLSSDPLMHRHISSHEAYEDPESSDEQLENDLLPMPHLTATTILGGTLPEQDTFGQLFATQIASSVLTKDPEETRLIVVGMGLRRGIESNREAFMDLVSLALKCI